MVNENAPSYKLHRIEYALLFRLGSCGNLCILGPPVDVFTTQVVHRSSLELDHACWPSLYPFILIQMIVQLDVFLQCWQLG